MTCLSCSPGAGSYYGAEALPDIDDVLDQDIVDPGTSVADSLTKKATPWMLFAGAGVMLYFLLK